MKHSFLAIAGAVTLTFLGNVQAEDALDLKVRNGWAVATHQDNLIAQRSVKTLYPMVTTTDAAQKWNYVASNAWTSGFFPASLWLLHQQFSSSAWNTAATVWQAGMEREKTNTGTQDLGFMVFAPFGNAYRLTGIDSYRQVTLTAANSLSQRYSSIVGGIRSWASDNNNYGVLIDIMMDIELMFWASTQGGDHVLYDQARRHALTTRNYLVRANGSSYHLASFNPLTGALKSLTTVQGYSDSSTWSRGQAWGIYGFTMTYRYTRETTFRDTARKMADWYIANLPSDSVPYWDFNDPAIPNAPRDSSAAAIAAAGLIELSLLESDATRASRYRTAARRALSSLLSAPYLARPISGTTAYNSEALLLQSAYNHHDNGPRYNQGTAWGDYYLLETMLRFRRINPGLPSLAVSRVWASSSETGNPPTNAIDNNLTTRWSALGNGQSITVDLGKNVLVQKVSVAFHNGNLRASRFDIATYNGVAWTTRFRGISSGQTVSPEFYDIPDVTARYVRIIGRGNTANLWNSITELDVY